MTRRAENDSASRLEVSIEALAAHVRLLDRSPWDTEYALTEDFDLAN